MVRGRARERQWAVWAGMRAGTVLTVLLGALGARHLFRAIPRPCPRRSRLAPCRVTGGQEYDYDAIGVRQACKSGDWKKARVGWADMPLRGCRLPGLDEGQGNAVLLWHAYGWTAHCTPRTSPQFSLGESGGASGGRTGGTIAAVRRGPAPVAPRAAAAAKVPLSRGASLKSGGGSAAVSRTTSASASLEQLEAAHQEAEALREQVGAPLGTGGWAPRRLAADSSTLLLHAPAVLPAPSHALPGACAGSPLPAAAHLPASPHHAAPCCPAAHSGCRRTRS